MRIGLPKESKAGELRVALTPEALGALAAKGHEVVLESGAGQGAGFTDADYAAQGVGIVDAPAPAYRADVVVKVKAPTDADWRHLQPNAMLLCFLNLPSSRELAATLLSQRITTLAYDTIEDRNGRLPILAPMSVISGELAITMGAHALLASSGGRGVAIKGARVVIFGAGNVGTAAAKMALALGADVTVISNPGMRMAKLAHQLGMNARTAAVTPTAVTQAVAGADLVIGAINTRGGPTPKLLTRAHIRSMGEGAVLVDVCIDGGGIAETSRQTTHSNPIYLDEGVLHIGIPNMPAAVPRSASLALSAAIAPVVEALATKGLATALREDDGLASGLQLFAGQVTHKSVASVLGRPWVDPDALLHAC